MYPGLLPLFEDCRQRAASRGRRKAPRWVQSSCGRYRRFPDTVDDKVKGDLERQSQNFIIQGLIADIVSLAAAELYEYPRHDIDYKLCLQIHDALACIVKNEHVPRFIDEVLPACMVQAVPIYPCHPDGTPQGTGPFYLGIDTEICTHWGVKPMPDELEARGIPVTYAGWKEKDGGLVHEEAFPRKIWLNGELRDYK